MRRRLLALLLFFLLIVVLVFSGWRLFARPNVGPPIALCPGPDAYGYTCEAGRAYDYVDATEDAGLYVDDGGVVINLPFGFTFYGSVYSQIWASSNGNLQLTSQNPGFENVCIGTEPAAGFGEMIAPYWDDLTFVFHGFLETAVVGSAPERIFVIEWDDVSSFVAPDETVTFEVQLFEGSNDIVFLYEDVSRNDGDQGRSATIGLQSESQGFALQHGCNQASIHNGGTVQFVYPPEQTGTAVALDGPPAGADPLMSIPKGDVAVLVDYLERYGSVSLPEARAYWLGREPQRDTQWQRADTTGDGFKDLIFLWRPAGSQAHLAQLAILSENPDRDWRPEWVTWPLARQEELGSPQLRYAIDLTGDGAADVLLEFPTTGRIKVASRSSGDWLLHNVPGRCLGSMVLRDMSGDGLIDIVRDGCGSDDRHINYWIDDHFE